MADFDFSRLPEELIYLIMKRLLFIEDFVRFGATCKSFETVVAANRRTSKPIFPPALLLVNDEDDAQDLRTFSCLSTTRQITIKLPDIRGRRCWGTPYGWLITLGLDFNLHLLNPFTGIRLSLPHMSTFPFVDPFFMQTNPKEELQICMRRVALSSNPSQDQNYSCIVVAVTNPRRQISFSKPGDKAWTHIESPGRIEDVIYFNSHIHAISCSRMLIVCDINSSPPKGIQIGTTPFPYEHKSSCDKFYLVNVCGELHVVVRFMRFVETPAVSDNNYATENFLVHKFDFQKREWITVTNLENHALFVGNNMSFAISTLDYPDFKRNAIYFTDDQIQDLWNTFCDMSVYDFEKKTQESFYKGSNVISEYSRPAFVIPGL